MGSSAAYSKQWDFFFESLPLCVYQMIKVLSEKHWRKSQGAGCVLKKLPKLCSASSPSTSSAAAAASKAKNATLSLSYTGCFLPLMTPPTIQGEALFFLGAMLVGLGLRWRIYSDRSLTVHYLRGWENARVVSVGSSGSPFQELLRLIPFQWSIHRSSQASGVLVSMHLCYICIDSFPVVRGSHLIS